MNLKTLEAKILKFEPDKEYVVAVSLRDAGVSPEELMKIAVNNAKVVFLLVENVDQIRQFEANEFIEMYSKKDGN